MAIYISIKKICEDSHFAEYTFGENDLVLGKIKIEKQSGNITVVEGIPSDDGFISQRAIRKIFLHWKEGEFPTETCWAS